MAFPHYAQSKLVQCKSAWKLPLHNQIHAFLWCHCDKQCNYRNENSWLIQAILATQEGCSCHYIHWGIFQKRLQWGRKKRIMFSCKMINHKQMHKYENMIWKSDGEMKINLGNSNAKIIIVFFSSLAKRHIFLLNKCK